jgi:hypothetical protein
MSVPASPRHSAWLHPPQGWRKTDRSSPYRMDRPARPVLHGVPAIPLAAPMEAGSGGPDGGKGRREAQAHANDGNIGQEIRGLSHQFLS